MRLIIDNREKIKELFIEKDSYVIELKNLDIGDYIVKYNEKDIIVIERKTISDLMSSIKDGRLREQKKRLLGNYQKNQIIYILEGEIKDTKYIKYDTIVSSIINTILRDNISVLLTKNEKNTVEMIDSICKKISKQGVSFLEREETFYDDILVNNLKKQKKSNISKEVCQKMMLSAIPYVSGKISDRLLLNFSSICNLIDTLKSIDESERILYIQNLPGIEEKTRKIPKNVAESIIKYLLDDNV